MQWCHPYISVCKSMLIWCSRGVGIDQRLLKMHQPSSLRHGTHVVVPKAYARHVGMQGWLPHPDPIHIYPPCTCDPSASHLRAL